MAGCLKPLEDQAERENRQHGSIEKGRKGLAIQNGEQMWYEVVKMQSYKRHFRSAERKQWYKAAPVAII